MTPLMYFRYLVESRSNPLHIEYLNGKKTLDVGCGEGAFLAKDPVNRIGIDIDADLVRKCADRGFVAHCMSATELVFADQFFDAVHSAELIEHLDPQQAVRFLAESARVLKPGGLIYITTPGERYVWNTFSHLKPYPPIAFEKLLGKSTEGFVRDQSLPLRLERAYAFGTASRIKVLTGLKRTFNIAFPCRNPTGYVIVLRKVTDITSNLSK